MRNRKSIFVLLVLAVLLAAANAVLRYGTRETRASGRQVLVETADGICRIRLERKGSPDVELGKVGTRWRIITPYSGRAEDQVVMKTIDKLSMTPITDVIVDSALLKLGRTRADFSLDEPGLSVELAFEKGNRERIDFGAKTPLGDGVYASIDGLDSVFIVPVGILEALDADAGRFRRRAIFTVDKNAVSAFSIKRGGEPAMELVRGESGWRVKDAVASQQKVSDFLSKITSATAESFVWPVGASNETAHASTALLAGYGLDPDTAVTVTLKDVDGTDRRVSFGKEAQDGKVYALVYGGAAIVTLPASLRAMAEQDAALFTDPRLFPSDSRSVGSFSLLDHDVLYAFVRGKDGGWSLESPIVARADNASVDAVLSRVLSLSASDSVSADEGIAVSLSTNSAKAVVSRESVFGTLAPEDLRSREIMKIDPTLVKRVVRTGGAEGAGPVSVVYDRERKIWTVENGVTDAVPNQKGIESVILSVSPLTALKIEKLKVLAADLDDYGLDKPSLTIAIDQEVDAAVRRNIMFGKKTKGGRFATIGASDAVFVIGDEVLERLSADIIEK